MKIKFPSNLYSREAVEVAAIDFSAWARFEIIEKDGAISVEAIVEPGMEIDENFQEEFSNYVIGQMA